MLVSSIENTIAETMLEVESMAEFEMPCNVASVVALIYDIDKVADGMMISEVETESDIP